MPKSIKAAKPQPLVACGLRAVSAFVRAGRARRLYYDRAGDNPRLRRLVEEAARRDVPVLPVAVSRLAAMAGGAAHQGAAAEVEPPAADLDAVLKKDAPLLAAVDGVCDPRNLGAVMRAAAAFGADMLIAPRHARAPLSPAALKAAGAAGAALPLLAAANLARTLRRLQDSGVRVYGACDDGAVDFEKVDLRGGVCWVFGGEARGLRRLTREHCDALVRAPTARGDLGILNVAVACGVCLAETKRRR